jgi:hypothetical protein
MAARNRLPDAPGANIRVEPCCLSVRLQHASPAWRAVGKAYEAAAQAWRDELAGGDRFNRRVASFETWRRLRRGEPSTFSAYNEARAKVISHPVEHPEDLAAKIQMVAEVLGVADPRRVGSCWRKDVPEGGWTLADTLFAVLWNDAHNGRRRVEVDRAKAKKGKR